MFLTCLAFKSVSFFSVSFSVKLNRLSNDLVGLFSSAELQHLHFFLLHLFVILEKSVDLLDDMVGELLDVVIVGDGHIALGNCDDLVVTFSLVHHFHDSDDFGFNKAQGLYFYAADDQDIQGIVIFTVGLRDESVVVGVVNRAKKNSIKFEEPAILIKFIFGLAFGGDLDDGVDHFWGVRAIGDVVPGILSILSLSFAFYFHFRCYTLYQQSQSSRINRIYFHTSYNQDQTINDRYLFEPFLFNFYQYTFSSFKICIRQSIPQILCKHYE